MKIDLNDKVTRVVVQEYVNALINFHNTGELDFDTHKLIHTFKVVETAQKLIDLTKPALPQKLKKQILNAAVLHDIGRCYEYGNGKQRKHFDHGQMGGALIRKYFPKLTVEALATQYHNKMPGENDPIMAQPVLDYTRDADMLGNLIYNTEHMPQFLVHILQQYPKTDTGLIINDEIVRSAKEHRVCHYHQMSKFDFLDMMVAQLNWIFNLRTPAAFILAKKEKLFSRYREILIREVLPVVPGSASQRRKTAKEIMELFPDTLFAKELKKHGV